MKLYEVSVEHELPNDSYSMRDRCVSQTYHIAAETEIEAKIKAIDRFRNEQKLKVRCTERNVEVVESSIMPSPEAGEPWWKRLVT